AVDKIDNHEGRIAPIARSAGEAFALIVRPRVALPVVHDRPPDCADALRMGSPKAVCQRTLICALAACLPARRFARARGSCRSARNVGLFVRVFSFASAESCARLRLIGGMT